MQHDAMNRVQYQQDLHGGFSNREARGAMPSPLPSPLWLNLGCGRDIREGFVNIDMYSDSPDVVYMDIRKIALPDNSADLILASDVLEHFSHREVDVVLAEWGRVLKPGGELVIRCPSLRLQVKAYVNKIWDADIASYMIFGGQTNPGDYHCIGFDEQSIKKHLAQAGFDVINFFEEDTPQDRGYINLNMTVQARKKMPIIQELVYRDNELRLFDVDDAYKQENVQPARQKEESHRKLTPQETYFSGISFTLQEDDEPQPLTEEAAQKEWGDAPPDSPINIVWEGSQFVYHSLALINREHCANIIDSELVNLTIVPYENDQFSPEGNDKYMKLQANDIRVKPKQPEYINKKPYCWIRHQWPPKAEPPHGAKWIIMQPWEFTEHRTDFAEIFRQADEIWTPSDYSRRTFVNAGVDFDKVQVVPNGIDPQLFKPLGDRYPLKTSKKIKLLFVGGTIYRKGIDILLQAYTRIFRPSDDICLVIKDMGGDSFYRNRNAREDILKIMREPDAPEIIYLEDSLTEHEMASLYRACDIFVSPYRGEGFSLPTLEAMACGLPVVVTQGGATDDFVDESVGWLVKSGKVSIGTTLDNVAMTGEAFLLEPDKSNLENILKKIYASANDVFHKGLAASLRARTQWTWKRATVKIFSRLDYLYGTALSIRAEAALRDFEDSSVILCKAEREWQHNNIKIALNLFEKALEGNSLSSKYASHAYSRLALHALDSGDLLSAEKPLSEAESRGINSIDLDYLRAELEYMKTNHVEALELVTPLLDSWMQRRFESTIGLALDTLLVFTGNVMLEMDDLEGSNSMFSSALKINGRNSDACFGSGRCFELAGAFAEAGTMYEWALKLDPDFKDAEEALARIQNQVDDSAEESL